MGINVSGRKAALAFFMSILMIILLVIPRLRHMPRHRAARLLVRLNILTAGWWPY